ncbi:hypothetical protein SNEBB_001068 [Seison nebaliae]|nr:hypothetical protein SNEBB_001068 [Seison nebaliae]
MSISKAFLQKHFKFSSLDVEQKAIEYVYQLIADSLNTLSTNRTINESVIDSELTDDGEGRNVKEFWLKKLDLLTNLLYEYVKRKSYKTDNQNENFVRNIRIKKEVVEKNLMSILFTEDNEDDTLSTTQQLSSGKTENKIFEITELVQMREDFSNADCAKERYDFIVNELIRQKSFIYSSLSDYLRYNILYLNVEWDGKIRSKFENELEFRSELMNLKKLNELKFYRSLQYDAVESLTSLNYLKVDENWRKSLKKQKMFHCCVLVSKVDNGDIYVCDHENKMIILLRNDTIFSSGYLTLNSIIIIYGHLISMNEYIQYKTNIKNKKLNSKTTDLAKETEGKLMYLNRLINEIDVNDQLSMNLLKENMITDIVISCDYVFQPTMQSIQRPPVLLPIMNRLKDERMKISRQLTVNGERPALLMLPNNLFVVNELQFNSSVTYISNRLSMIRLENMCKFLQLNSSYDTERFFIFNVSLNQLNDMELMQTTFGEILRVYDALFKNCQIFFVTSSGNSLFYSSNIFFPSDDSQLYNELWEKCLSRENKKLFDRFNCQFITNLFSLYLYDRRILFFNDRYHLNHQKNEIIIRNKKLTSDYSLKNCRYLCNKIDEIHHSSNHQNDDDEDDANEMISLNTLSIIQQHLINTTNMDIGDNRLVNRLLMIPTNRFVQEEKKEYDHLNFNIDIADLIICCDSSIINSDIYRIHSMRTDELRKLRHQNDEMMNKFNHIISIDLGMNEDEFLCYSPFQHEAIIIDVNLSQ